LIRQAVIMAGGRGTRLSSVTNDKIPKPMVPLAGRPLLELQIDTLREQGITDIILVIGYLGQVIQDYFGDGTAFGVHIDYIKESVPLGTAGALAMLPPLLREDSFFLVFGDVLFDIDLARMLRFHEEKESLSTLFVHPNTHPFDSDLVVCGRDGRVQKFDSKHNVRNYWYSNCVNAGLYIFNAEVCRRVPKETKIDLEKELLSGLIGEGAAVYGYSSPEYIKDVGTVDRITKAMQELQDGFIKKRSLRKKQKAIFLDRDGTINKKNGLVFQEKQFELEPCAIEAIRAINDSGYLAILVTNQPVVARGLCSIEDVERIHRKLETLLGREGVYLDGIRFCPHHPDKGYLKENPMYKIPCHCRKPDIGMLVDCKDAYNIDLKESWIIGDTTVDIQTGKNAGCHTALVLTGDAGKDGKYAVKPEHTDVDLLEAVRRIIDIG